MVKLIRRSKITRYIVSFLLLTFTSELLLPLKSFALTSGPNSPEFSSFTPVSTTNMVDMFSGDFSYNLPVINIPGTHGGGYALSLAYKAGSTVEDEASWVGYGWSLNPGSIKRNMRGFPDDIKGKEIDVYNKTPVNWTLSTGSNATVEFYSSDIGLGINSSTRYNNYTGLMRMIGMNVNVKGAASIGFHFDGSNSTVSATISPAGILHAIKGKKEGDRKTRGQFQKEVGYARRGTEDCRKEVSDKFKADHSGKTQNRVSGSNSTGIFSYDNAMRQTSVAAFVGFSCNFQANVMPTIFPTAIGPKFGVSGSINVQWNQHKNETKTIYGYFYNQSIASNNSAALRDYAVENQSPFVKRDFFLSVPFNNADIYSVAGEGLSGGFRVHHTKIGQMYPNKVVSPVTNIGLGIDIDAGNPLGVGIDLSFGANLTRQGNWLLPIADGAYPAYESNYALFRNDMQFDDEETDNLENRFFRFNNDLGGDLNYDPDSANFIRSAVFRDNEPISPLPGSKMFRPSLQKAFKLDEDPTRKGRNIYTEFKLNQNLNSASDLFSHDAEIDDLNVTRKLYSASGVEASKAIGEGIGSYQITAAGGTRFVYDLPVYNQEEVDVRYGLEDDHLEFDGTGSKERAFYKNFLTNDVAPNESNPWNDVDNHNFKTVVGERVATPYASDYLLTHILTPDYYDLTNDGPTSDDYGGWTRFVYKKKYGGTNTNGDWYRWRTPYQGLNYARNELSLTKDDLCGVKTGLKEVHYLKYIETETHIACFITNKTVRADFNGTHASSFFNNSNANLTLYLTGSGVDRLDGVDAAESSTMKNSARGTHQLERLEKIVLFAKDRPDKPIKVVNLQYSQTLTPGIPNSSDGHSGKLTLEKIWFDYEGTKSVKVSPYIFKYQYKKITDFATEVTARYPFLHHTSVSDPYDWPAYTPTQENPPYSIYAMDAWGTNRNVQRGKESSARLKTWVDQSRSTTNNYDPAAWQLKQIILPSGGEILVQYEQDEYQTVQDRPALAMVSLTNETLDANPLDHPADNRYYLNPMDLGLGSTYNAAWLDYETQLNNYFNNEKIYFKFLYAIKRNVSPTIDNRLSEYIDGYADVKKCVVESATNRIYIKLGRKASGGLVYPKTACKEFVKTNRGGVGSGGNEEYDNIDREMTHGMGVDAFADIVGVMIKNSITGVVGNIIGMIADDTEICVDMSPELSYLRVPVYYPKIGGGLRVKRLLTYDKGLENGDAQLYGERFSYNDAAGKSYGVAVNEPKTIHEENALVTFLPRLKQGFLDRLIYGRDKKQVEGPIGETILPGASVGYSQVTVKSIHEGVTSSGKVVHEFFTAKDYPFDKLYENMSAQDGTDKGVKGVDYTNLQAEGHRGKDYLIVPAGLLSFTVSKVWCTQGFRFIINNMHGQPKKTCTYNAADQLISKQEFEYYEPGETIKTLGLDPDHCSSSPLRDLKVYTDCFPGREMDITMNTNGVNDFVFDLGFQIDISVLIMSVPIVYVSFGGFTLTFNNTGINTHVTTKVVNYPAILKSTTSYVDGITHIEENVAFDRISGEPILKRTSDSYDQLTIGVAGYTGTTGATGTETHDGSIYQLSVPAHLYYPEMGQKAASGAYSNQVNEKVGAITSYGTSGNMLNSNWFSNPQDVTSASFTSYKKDWRNGYESFYTDYSIGVSGPTGSQNYRAEKQYSFLNSISPANPANIASNYRNYNGGILPCFQYYEIGATGGCTGFSGSYGCSGVTGNNNWQLVSQVTGYSPHGEALEERNALGVYSAVKYGYQKQLPVVIGQNTKYNNLLFRSFEDESLSTLTSVDAHTGNKSYSWNSQVPFSISGNFNISQSVRNSGLLISAWVKEEGGASLSLSDKLIPLINAGSNGFSYSVSDVCSVNGWHLVNIFIKNITLSDASYSVELTKLVQGLLVDDVKIQPLNSSARCLVYDPITFRLVAEFAQSHFATVYQYNQEGKLVRKLIETEKGVKTVQETQYNMPKGIVRGN